MMVHPTGCIRSPEPVCVRPSAQKRVLNTAFEQNLVGNQSRFTRTRPTDEYPGSLNRLNWLGRRDSRVGRSCRIGSLPRWWSGSPPVESALRSVCTEKSLDGQSKKSQWNEWRSVHSFLSYPASARNHAMDLSLVCTRTCHISGRTNEPFGQRPVAFWLRALQASPRIRRVRQLRPREEACAYRPQISSHKP